MEGVEGVEKLLLRFLLLAEELNVVDEEHVTLFPELAAKVGHPVIAHALDELVGELLRGQIDNARGWSVRTDLIPDRVEQMGFSQTRPAVDKERVVATPRILRDRRGPRG